MSNIITLIPFKLKEQRLTYHYATGVTDLEDSSAYPTGQYRDSTPNPNWDVMIAKNQDATTPYTTYKRWFKACRHNIDIYNTMYPDDGARFDFDFTGPWTYITRVDDTALEDAAIASFKKKVAGCNKEFNALVPTAELSELRSSIKWLADSCLTVTRGLVELHAGVKHLVHARTKPAKRRLHDASRRASDMWLGWGFGVAPTISDIQSILVSIDGFLERSPNDIRLRTTRTKRFTRSFEYPQQCRIWDSVVDVRVDDDVELKVTIVGALNPLMRFSNDYSLSDQLGFSFKNLPSVAWELTPYSWIVDYFTTAGDYFSDVFEAPPGNLVYIMKGVKCNIYRRVHVSDPYIFTGNPFQVYRFSQSEGYNGYLKRYERTPLASLPHTPFRFKTADEIGYHSVTKLLNLASLLVK